MTPLSPPARRYFRRGALAFTAYAILAVAVAAWTRGAQTPAPPLTWIAALLPVAPVVAAVAVTARYFAGEADSVQRAIHIEALLWAVGVTFGVATAWGLLQPLAGAPAVPSYCAFAVFSSVVASVQVSRRLFPRRPGADAP